eukprot:413096-Pyramimonas_sp.AAC.3
MESLFTSAFVSTGRTYEELFSAWHQEYVTPAGGRRTGLGGWSWTLRERKSPPLVPRCTLCPAEEQNISERNSSRANSLHGHRQSPNPQGNQITDRGVALMNGQDRLMITGNGFMHRGGTFGRCRQSYASAFTKNCKYKRQEQRGWIY